MSLTLTPDILQKYPNPVFFETGTWYGGGVRLANDLGFRTIYTLDIEESFIQQIKSEFPHVNAIHGDSRKVFSEILASITEPVTFWLDSHALLDGQECVTTVVSELSAIISWWRPGSTVLIDDLRMFGYGGCWGESCSFERLLGLAGMIAKEHKLTISFEDTNAGVCDILVIA